jgi:hypothetical protein
VLFIAFGRGIGGKGLFKQTPEERDKRLKRNDYYRTYRKKTLKKTLRSCGKKQESVTQLSGRERQSLLGKGKLRSKEIGKKLLSMKNATSIYKEYIVEERKQTTLLMKRSIMWPFACIMEGSANSISTTGG